MNGLKPLVVVIGMAAMPIGQARSASDRPGAYALPLAEATDWTVSVFNARSPLAAGGQPIAFSVHVRWEVGDGSGDTELTGKVAPLRTVELPLRVPAGFSALALALDWETPGVDLDVGLFCPSRKLRLAPILTVLKPERVRWDAQTAKLYDWLAKEHPDWWKGYPFWAEVEPAPTPSRGEGE